MSRAVWQISGGPISRSYVEVSEESLKAAREATTLDRVHAAMLLLEEKRLLDAMLLAAPR